MPSPLAEIKQIVLLDLVARILPSTLTDLEFIGKLPQRIPSLRPNYKSSRFINNSICIEDYQDVIGA